MIVDEFFIGREYVQQRMEVYINSDRSEFTAVYGCRRVGRTSPIQQVMGRDYASRVAGMNNVSLCILLSNFTYLWRN